MKKVNFKKLTNQFLAGVFGLALMGGVMLHTQDVEAQSAETWYEAKVTIEQTLSGTFIVSTCTSIPGSSCNMPGSIHRVKVPKLINIW